MNRIYIFNTLTGKKEPLEPLEKNRVKMYVCGPTVYDDVHIGHARTFIFFDFVRKFLEYVGYDVRYVLNITDVDDKIIRAARERGISSLDYAEEYTRRFLEDYLALKLRPPDVFPRVTKHIEEIIDFIQKLIDKNFAYTAPDGVYYRVKAFKGYGKLSKRSLEEMLVGARVEVSEGKKDPLDFALWKAKKKEEDVCWSSPWGSGRPGWHIECSVMSMKYLGEQFDIHGGGSDLIFPHHENEIAQSEALTGKVPARYWIHVGMLQISGEKMSKSLGNIIKIRDILRRYSPEVVKFYVLNTHYRKPVDYTEESLEEAKKTLDIVVRAYDALGTLISSGDYKHSFRITDEEMNILYSMRDAKDRVLDALSDDFNTREALKELMTFSKDVYQAIVDDKIKSLTVAFQLREFIGDLSNLFGILEEEPISEEHEILARVIEEILKLREEFRKVKNWEVADAIRAALNRAGIHVDDTRRGPVWRIIR
ncbi:MAG TPA: cysteine--tRNA ligase [Thermoprotei archaeon]|nr:cysteine--tRNA ligase [Thermoprotei archaeon]